MTKPETLLLGIDIGLSGAKCTFYSDKGRPVAGSHAEYPTTSPHPGWAEQNPDHWWKAVTANIRDCIDRQGVDASAVAAVGVSCSNTIVPVDRDGNVLHNAILLFDQRTGKEVQWVKDEIGEDRIYRITGNRIARGTYSLPTILWLMRNKPDVMKRAWKVLVPSGFIVQRLTDVFSINRSRMSFTLLADLRKGAWDADLARDAGVPLSILPDPYAASAVVGCVTPDAANATGLRAGTPVVAGAMDTVSASFASGAARENTVFLTIGTTVRLCHTTTVARFDKRLMNTANVFGGTWLEIGATNTAGASLRWFRDTLGGARSPGEKVTYAQLDAAAAASPPGAGGVIFLPYMAGERSPLWNPDAKGVFFGIGLPTTYADMVRAVMEGVSYSVRQLVEIVMTHPNPSSTIAISGGVARSPLWCQIIADMLRHPLIQLEAGETETLGAALIAGHGVGLIPDPLPFVDRLVKKGRKYMPVPENAHTYDAYYPIFTKLYKDIAETYSQHAAVQQTA